MPGDILIYTGWSFFDLLIRIKTGSFACHCERYQGGGFSLASRNGKGVSKYPLRLMGLAYVLRPSCKPDFDKGLVWFYAKANGKPYGWLDLLEFVCLKILSPGLICSEFMAMLFDAEGCPLFAGHWDRGAISPRDFLIVGGLDMIYRKV